MRAVRFVGTVPHELAQLLARRETMESGIVMTVIVRTSDGGCSAHWR
jgi:hypothetical protein